MQIGLIKIDENKCENKSILVPKQFTHSCAIGQTGCGKTSSYIYENLDDRIKANHSILVYDYKGKEHINVKYFADKNNRLEDVIEIGKDWGQSINLIKYFTKSDLEDLLYDLFGRNDKDIFWSRSSASVCLAIFDILKITDNLCKLIKQINPDFNIQKYISQNLDMEFNPSYTFKSLLLQTSTLKKLKEFYTNLYSIHNCFSSISEKLLMNDKYIDEKYFEKKYLSLYYELENLSNTCMKSLNSLDYIIDNKSDSVSIHSLIMCINSPLRNIASIENLNNDNFDVIKALNENKIIVVNVKNFSDLILSSFNNSIFSELTKNSYKFNNSTSIFIDEAQRVLSSNFELPIDVLRECRVEIFLAFQNQELIIEKIGKNKFESLIKNIKNRYIFRNPGFYENYDLSSLNTFEYYDDEKMDFKVYKSIPTFIPNDDSFEVEFNYQKINKIKEKYQFSSSVRNAILVYDESKFINNLMVLRDKNGDERTVNIYDKEVLRVAKNILNRQIYSYFDEHRKIMEYKKNERERARRIKEKDDIRKNAIKIDLVNKINKKGKQHIKDKLNQLNDQDDIFKFDFDIEETYQMIEDEINSINEQLHEIEEIPHIIQSNDIPLEVELPKELLDFLFESDEKKDE